MNLAIGPAPERAVAPPAPPRVSERAILRLGIGLAGSFMLAAVLSGLMPVGALHGWVATHLALAGAATVAIGTFMPHFAVTLAGTRPEPWGVRLAGLVSLAAGMATVAIGRPLVGSGVAALGGTLVIGGIAATAWTTFGPLRRGIVRRQPVVQLVYALALAELAVGASLAVALLAGWPPVVGAWVALKPAHAWLNVFGFVSLTVTGTLIYLYPTMVGARMRPGAALAAGVAGLSAGPPLAAAGYAAGLQPVVVIGGGALVVGAIGLLAYGVETYRRRGRWTTDMAWHALATYHGLAAMGWLVIAAAGALWRGLMVGIIDPGWSLGALSVPVIGGWATQILVAAWSYLLPAVGPGDPASRARQRSILGLGATMRLVAWNLGLVLLLAGLLTSAIWALAMGVALFFSAALASLGLLAGSLWVRPGSTAAGR